MVKDTLQIQEDHQFIAEVRLQNLLTEMFTAYKLMGNLEYEKILALPDNLFIANKSIT